MNTETRLTNLSNQFYIGCVFVLVPWLIGSGYLWQFSSDSIVVPLSAETFALPFELLKGNRVILSSAFLHPVLFLFSFISLILLIASLGLFYFILPKPHRLGFALLGLSFFYKFGAPGINPIPMADAFFSLALVVPLFRMPSSLVLWLLGSMGVYFCATNPSYQFPIFWLTLSLSFGPIISFLFADKGQPKREFRLHPLRHIPNLAALFLFGFWVLSSILTTPTELSIFRPSVYWPIAWIICLECIILTWFEPNKTARWLSIGFFAQGLLLSQPLERYVIYVLIALSLEFLRHPALTQKVLSYIPKKVQLGFQLILILLAVTIMSIDVNNFEPRRNFEAHWISIFREMDKLEQKENRGFLVVGEGMPFLAHFMPTVLVRDDSVLLKSSETELKKTMEEYRVTDIIVDKKFLNDFWRKWIADGKPPEAANNSVISRAIAYDGKEVETSTLKLPALKEIASIKVKESAEFAWLKKRK